jgi:hypothetical protein
MSHRALLFNQSASYTHTKIHPPLLLRALFSFSRSRTPPHTHGSRALTHTHTYTRKQSFVKCENVVRTLAAGHEQIDSPAGNVVGTSHLPRLNTHCRQNVFTPLDFFHLLLRYSLNSIWITFVSLALHIP